MKFNQSPPRRFAAGALKAEIARITTWFTLGLLFALPAASTDISNMPINSTSVTLASPNIMLLMDTSKSILFTHAPNLLEGAATPLPPAPQSIGYRANQCNSIYYNPATKYTDKVPVDSTGTPLMSTAQLAALFAAAPYNYFTPSSANVSSPSGRATVNLNSQFQAFDRNSRARNSTDANDEEQRAYYYVYTTTSGATPTLSYASAPCSDAYGTPSTTAVPQSPTPAGASGLVYPRSITSGALAGQWTRVLVGDPATVAGTSAVYGDERLNFAIWYTFYRTRVSLTKSGIGLAFSTLGTTTGNLPEDYRVGFINGNPLTKPGGDVNALGSTFTGAAVDPSMYTALAKFDATQRANWYTMLYAQVPGGSSPMREGLARVGRHYANKNDSINNGMTLQPAADDQSCRQNFTLMTTGGYWSRAAETQGPVKIDGSTAVGQQDGDLGATVTVNGSSYLISPRPIWDGGTTGTSVSTDNWNTYSAASCVTGSVMRSTVQNRRSTSGMQQTVYPATLQSTSQVNVSTTATTKSTSQLTQSTAQTTQSTAQINLSTSQLNKSTSQLKQSTSQVTSSIPTLSTSQLNITTTAVTSSTSQQTQSSSQLTQSTSQLNRSTSQIVANTSQLTMSTSQLVANTPIQWTEQLNIVTTAVTASTSQLTKSTTHTKQNTSQKLQSTSQITASTSQLTQSTSQLTSSTPTSSTSQLNKSTSQVTSSSTQLTQSTSQLARSTSQLNQSTSQLTQSTSQLRQSTSQLTASTSQLNQQTSQLTASTSQPIQTTTTSTMSTSQWWATDSQNSTPVATCTPSTQITCYNQVTGPTQVVPGTCVVQAATSANNFTSTSCSNPTPVSVAVSACSPQTATSGNGYVQITCSFNTTPAVGVASCTPGTNASYVTTSCNTVTTGPTPVASCAAASATSANGYTTTTCPTLTTGPTGVASCVAASASSSNAYTSTTCNTVTSGPTGVASCTPGTSASFVVTSCATANTGPTGVASCSPVPAGSGNSYTATTCNTVTTGPTPVPTCSAASASSGNLYTTTTCPVVSTGPTGVASCTASAANSGNSYTATTCPTVTTGPTGVASCTAATADSTNSYTTTTCNTVPLGPTPVASCTPGTSGTFVVTTCNTVTTGPTPIGACTPASANSGNAYTVTTCPVVATGPTAAPSGCTAVLATATTTPAWTATTCGWTTPVGVGTCTSSATVTCNTLTNGPTGVASCTPAAASSGNSYIAVTCNTVTGGPTGVSSCTGATASSGNLYTATTCNTVTTTNVPVASCSTASKSTVNFYTSTTCPTPVTTSGWVASCTAASADSTNAYTTTTCPVTATGPTGVSSCSPITATALNSWTTTSCNTVTTGPTGVTACTPVSAASGNSYTATTCNTVTTGPTPTGSCTPVAAGTGNSWVATTCPVVATAAVGVTSCTPVAASSGNNWTATLCGWTAATGAAVCVPSPTQLCNTVATGPTPVGSCTPALASASNNYVTTTCNTVTTGPTGVASCVNTPASAGNSWTAITCPGTVTTGPTPVTACAVTPASSGNSWTATTCPVVNTGPTGVASCTAAPADGTNAYTSTSCNTVTSGPGGVASCTPQTAAAINSYVDITCNTVDTGPTGVTACTPIAATALNSWTTTSCNTDVNGPTPTGSCTNAVASSGNSWIATACTTATSGPTPAPLGCTPLTASAGTTPPWTATTCSWTAAAGVASCVASATQICSTVLTGPLPVASCTPASADGTNAYTATSCTTTTTGPTGVSSCTPGTDASFVVTSCNTATTGPTPSAACTPTSAGSGNSWTATTCNTVSTGPTGVASCNAVPADASTTPPWTATTCGTAISGPTGVSSCTPAAANGSNSYVDTSCSTVSTGPTPVASCTPVAASAGTTPPWTATTCNTVPTGPTPAASCTAASPNGSNAFIGTTCSTTVTGPTAVGSCNQAAADGTNAYTATTCVTPASVTTWVPSCTAVSASAPSWIATTCNPVASGPTPVATCTPGTDANFVVTTCDQVTTPPTGPVAASACTPGMDLNFVNTTCDAVPGAKVQYQTTTEVTTQVVSGGFSVGAPSVVTTPGTLTDLDGVCYSQAQQPVLFATAPAFSAGGAPTPGGVPPIVRPPLIPSTVPTALTSVAPAPPSLCAGWPCVVGIGSIEGGSTNSLADVAQYYYATDLRPELPDNVFVGQSSGYPNEDDRLKSQHMTTFVVGLGVSGTLDFTTDYTSGTGDFSALRTGVAVAGQGSGATSWPVWPTSATTYESQFNDPRSIDDFWHTAVDGRGRFFSARDPASLISGIKGALEGISSSSGTSAGATMATQMPVPGNNAIFGTSFVTGKWTGDVLATTVSAAGVSGTATWSAQANLNSRVSLYCDGRDIRLIRTTGSTSTLVPFTWNTQPCDASGNPFGTATTGLNATELAYFGATQVNRLSQFGTGSTLTAAQINAAEGLAPSPNVPANLVNFLRGQKGYQGDAVIVANQIYRARDSALGDIVDSQLAYVGPPSQLYGDAGYSNFVSNNASRTAMAYVGGNDGMLHAFNATTGVEAWAVIPTSVLPNLYALADMAYGSAHQFYVDGSPTSGDIYNGTDWKTILVGGLNDGGKGYYALDVTDPTTPKALWEFKASSLVCLATDLAAIGNSSDCNLGLTFGRPVITKLADGVTWVVLVTSGYNNTTDGGNGQGYLYVLNAYTGQIIRRIGTGVGDTTGPSGLRELTTYVSNPKLNNTALWVYGGDLLGNLWRFDINAASSAPAVLVTSLRAADNTAQSVTTRINLAEVNGNTFLMVGTGRLLGASDISNTQQQTVYSIMDPMAAPTVTSPPTAELDPATLRAGLKPITLTTTGSLVSGDLVRTALPCSGSSGQCASTAGWYMDLTQGLTDATLGSERVTIDMALASGTLVFQSNIPSASQCASGYNLFNQLDFVTGLPVGGSAVTKFGTATLGSGATLAMMPDGSLKWIVTTTKPLPEPPGMYDVAVAIPAPVGKRISWREIVQ